MPRKKKEAAPEPKEEKAPGIAPLGFSFNREDLNALQAKLNEVIEKVNG